MTVEAVERAERKRRLAEINERNQRIYQAAMWAERYRGHLELTVEVWPWMTLEDAANAVADAIDKERK